MYSETMYSEARTNDRKIRIRMSETACERVESLPSREWLVYL